MPPEGFPCHCHPIAKPLLQFLPQEPPRSLWLKYCRGSKRMIITKRKLIPLLFFILSGFSILRLLNISSITSFSPPTPTATAPLPPIFSTGEATLTEKEYNLLSNLISLKAPCNLLVFGLEEQYLNLSKINVGGNTVFLEDNPEKLNLIATTKTQTNYKNFWVYIVDNSTRIYRVTYQTRAGDAYKLLKQARLDPACGLNSSGRSLEKSNCSLALTRLPKEVYQRKWDVVVVDGPRGDAPAVPGRMAAIYTASVMARAGNMAHVIVHDVHRMIEKWFSWEFLEDENLVSSKGKLWNFRIASKSNSTMFLSSKTSSIE